MVRIQQNSEGGRALQAQVQQKLKEYLGEDYADEVLPLYIVVMLSHGNSQALVAENLDAFLGDNCADFAQWLFEHIEEHKAAYEPPAPSPEPPKPVPPQVEADVGTKAQPAGKDDKPRRTAAPEKLEKQPESTERRSAAPLKSRVVQAQRQDRRGEKDAAGRGGKEPHGGRRPGRPETLNPKRTRQERSRSPHRRKAARRVAEEPHISAPAVQDAWGPPRGDWPQREYREVHREGHAPRQFGGPPLPPPRQAYSEQLPVWQGGWDGMAAAGRGGWHAETGWHPDHEQGWHSQGDAHQTHERQDRGEPRQRRPAMPGNAPRTVHDNDRRRKREEEREHWSGGVGEGYEFELPRDAAAAPTEQRIVERGGGSGEQRLRGRVTLASNPSTAAPAPVQERQRSPPTALAAAREAARASLAPRMPPKRLLATAIREAATSGVSVLQRLGPPAAGASGRGRQPPAAPVRPDSAGDQSADVSEEEPQLLQKSTRLRMDEVSSRMDDPPDYTAQPHRLVQRQDPFAAQQAFLGANGRRMVKIDRSVTNLTLNMHREPPAGGPARTAPVGAGDADDRDPNLADMKRAMRKMEVELTKLRAEQQQLAAAAAASLPLPAGSVDIAALQVLPQLPAASAQPWHPTAAMRRSQTLNPAIHHQPMPARRAISSESPSSVPPASLRTQLAGSGLPRQNPRPSQQQRPPLAARLGICAMSLQPAGLKQKRTVRVSNLHPTADEALLEQRFAACGTVAGVKLVRDAAGRPSGVGYIAFADEAGAEAALKLSGSLLQQQHIKVTLKGPNAPLPLTPRSAAALQPASFSSPPAPMLAASRGRGRGVSRNASGGRLGIAHGRGRGGITKLTSPNSDTSAAAHAAAAAAANGAFTAHPDATGGASVMARLGNGRAAAAATNGNSQLQRRLGPAAGGAGSSAQVLQPLATESGVLARLGQGGVGAGPTQTQAGATAMPVQQAPKMGLQVARAVAAPQASGWCRAWDWQMSSVPAAQ